MREIKFRAFDKDRGNMEYIDDLYWFEEEGVRDSSGDGHFANYIIMQYTGLKDKNGKEIYEGDIIKRLGHIGKVIWFEDGYFVELFDGKDREFEGFYPYWSELKTMKNGEIIGNIYENPELLSD